MKKWIILCSVAFFGVAYSPSGNNAERWTSDKESQGLDFEIKVHHLKNQRVGGRFHDLSASLVTYNQDFTKAVMEIVVQVESVTAEVDYKEKVMDGPEQYFHSQQYQALDMNLLTKVIKGPEFFNLEEYPTASFKSTNIKKVGPNNYLMQGNLTIRGVTKEVYWRAIHKSTTQDRKDGRTLIELEILGSLLRSDFGLGTSSLRNKLISDKILVHSDIRFVYDGSSEI